MIEPHLFPLLHLFLGRRSLALLMRRQLEEARGPVAARQQAAVSADGSRPVHRSPRARRIRQQAAVSALLPRQSQPEGRLAEREPGPADAHVSERRRRGDRPGGAHVLSTAPARVSQRGYVLFVNDRSFRVISYASSLLLFILSFTYHCTRIRFILHTS